MIEGFREVKESSQAALWLGGLQAITDGLRDCKDLVLTGAKRVEASHHLDVVSENLRYPKLVSCL